VMRPSTNSVAKGLPDAPPIDNFTNPRLPFCRFSPPDLEDNHENDGKRSSDSAGESNMRFLRIICVTLLISVCSSSGVQTQMRVQNSVAKRTVIAASTVLDGKGHIFHNTRIVIEGPKIVAIDPKAGPVDYDLRGLTV